MKCNECNKPDHKVITNADRIRDMTDEELAEILEKIHSNCIRHYVGLISDSECEVSDCKVCGEDVIRNLLIKWLKAPINNI